MCSTDGRGFEPLSGLNFHQCLQTCLQVHGSKRFGCLADLYTVSRCHSRGESEESIVCRRGSTQARESTLALKPRADITRSPKQGYQWPHKRTCVLQKFLKKNMMFRQLHAFRNDNVCHCIQVSHIENPIDLPSATYYPKWPCNE